MADFDKLKKIQDCRGRVKEIVGDEGCLKLAKDGIIPHYVIKNPITKEESIWFSQCELNKWLNKNYIRYNRGYFSTNYDFLYFNKEICRISSKSEIPDQLIKISNLFQLPLNEVDTPPGIYFLCKGKQIQYIGKSGNIKNRILTHISEGLKDFDSVYFITCSMDKLEELENSLIRFFKPILNIVGKKADLKNEDIEILKSLSI